MVVLPLLLSLPVSSAWGRHGTENPSVLQQIGTLASTWVNISISQKRNLEDEERGCLKGKKISSVRGWQRQTCTGTSVSMCGALSTSLDCPLQNYS